jgi:conjugative relaxase-like TrwC/TraI family protein
VTVICLAACQALDRPAEVLSIGKLTVEQSRYYERQVAQGRDDYYSGRGESPGRWTGTGAESLRLAGRVDDDGFMALMDGRDPGTGERLKRVGGRSKWRRLI